ncbi:RNA-binding protein [Brevundimonas vesicularis]|uniref:RNA-binding protein n=1 Tax=Brevundimonas vesicularis TaxID=41276 RepID=A0A1Z3U8Q4_BREVE|nr:RNA-binding protein [Brevundimonas vesicularis]ASE39686.1 RNA-binding protein [Brevundimonas vesicularis]MDX2334871.1 RNA-binding protein [Brevundimonas vesicularis]
MSLRDATIDRERRDLVSHEVMDESRLIRFVAGPDGQVVPDLGRKLPGRGLWVEASRTSVEAAVKKNGFTRAAKTKLTAPADLADVIERLLARRCLDQLGLARREGVLISGFEKTAASLRAGKAAWVLEAADGSADGRGKILALARHQTAKICGAFTADDLSLALGLENAIHAVLLAGGRADRWTIEVERLAGFRPLRPPHWDVSSVEDGSAGAPPTGAS